MNPDLKFILTIVFGSGLCSGIVSAFLGAFLTRKKYRQEVVVAYFNTPEDLVEISPNVTTQFRFNVTTHSDLN